MHCSFGGADGIRSHWASVIAPIARVNYSTQRVFVLYLLTHSEYDEGAWKQ